MPIPEWCNNESLRRQRENFVEFWKGKSLDNSNASDFAVGLDNLLMASKANGHYTGKQELRDLQADARRLGETTSGNTRVG